MPSRQDLLRDAMAAAGRKDYARAVEMLGVILRGGEDASLRFNRAVMLQQLGRHADAIADYDRSLTLRRDDPEAFFNRAVSREALGQPHDALEDYSRALALRPRHAPTLNNRGSVFAATGKQEEALADFSAALKLSPRDIRALYNAGNVLRALDRNEEAIALYDRALVLNPRHADAWNNRALALETLYRWDEARSSIDRAVALGATLERLLNRAHILLSQNRASEALAAYDAALTVDRDSAEAALGKAGVLLALGRYEEAWPLHEARWRAAEGPRLPIQAAPLWLGESDIAGRTLLLHGEQGFGDTIQFSRYAAAFKARGARVVMRVQPALKALLREGLDGPDEVLGYDEPAQAADFHLPLMSAPLACRTTLATIPAGPYLRADPARVAAWRARLGDAPLVGLAWRGDARTALRRRRSIPLPSLSPLLGLARFVSLQVDANEEEQSLLTQHGVPHFGDALRDFREHAALITACDLVISIDTVVAHLAGAMGRPTWILLPFWSDWRWMLERDDSPWHPTARLFRQREGGNWDDPITRVGDAIRTRGYT